MSTPHGTRPLPLPAKLLYSANGLGEAALLQTLNVWLVYFYAPPENADRETLLGLATVSALLFAGRFIEAFDDALIGWWSDRTSTRWGRRAPFILLATPAWALFAFLLFLPPAGDATLTAIWFFLIFQGYSLCSTLVGGPYEALLPELATTSAERISLSTISVYLGVAGSGIGLIGSGLLRDSVGFTWMAAAVAGWAVLWRYVGLFGVWQRATVPRPAARIALQASLRSTFANSHFLVFLPTFVLFNVGFLMMLGVLPYYVKAVLHAEQEGSWVALLSGVAVLAILAAAPFFARLARRTSKAHAYNRAMLLAAVVFPVFAVAGLLPGVPAGLQVVAAAGLAGLPLAGIFLFPSALTADICDHDAQVTGLRREATFYGVQNWVEKSAAALSPLLLALVLLLGARPGDELGVRLVGPVAGMIVFSAYLVFRRYSLADDAQLAISDVPLPAASTTD